MGVYCCLFILLSLTAIYVEGMPLGGTEGGENEIDKGSETDDGKVFVADEDEGIEDDESESDDEFESVDISRSDMTGENDKFSADQKLAARGGNSFFSRKKNEAPTVSSYVQRKESQPPQQPQLKQVQHGGQHEYPNIQSLPKGPTPEERALQEKFGVKGGYSKDMSDFDEEEEEELDAETASDTDEVSGDQNLMTRGGWSLRTQKKSHEKTAADLAADYGVPGGYRKPMVDYSE